MTYKGEHDHQKPEEIKNFVVGTSQNKSSKTRLPTAGEARSCPAKKYVEKSKTHENAYIVTYKGEHDHQKPEEIKNFVVGTSQNKSSKTRLPTAGEARSSPNVKNLVLPNVVTFEFNHPESSNARVLAVKSKIPYSSPNIGSLGSHNKHYYKIGKK